MSELLLASKLAGRTLGTAQLSFMEKCNSKNNRVVFVTVNPNPETKHAVDRTVWVNERTPVKVKHMKLAYMAMTYKEQHEYLTEYIKAVYVHRLEPEDYIYWVYELTEGKGRTPAQLHAHLLITGLNYRKEFDLLQLRQDVYSNLLTQRNLAKKSKTDWMNCIVWADNPKELFNEYFTKQTDTGIKDKYPDQWCHI